MVAVIINLLSTVAIPNFQKYQARSKTSKAKPHLAAVYTAENSFYSDYNMFATCLRYMGYDPSEEAASHYHTVGFNVPNVADNDAYKSAINSELPVGECTPVLAVAPNLDYHVAGKK
jgi:type IV pilus assembly protein PilA